MDVELTDGTLEGEALRTATAVRVQRWPILVVGLVGSVILVVFGLGYIPGLSGPLGVGAAVGVFFGAAFLAVAGLVSWWLWTRIANTRSRRVVLSDQGVTIDFVNLPTARLNWSERGLRFSIREPPNSSIASSATLLWGSGRMGQYAFIRGAASELVRSEAAAHGFRGITSATGKPPYVWTTTEFSHR
jgi:hypothetical protein